MKSAPPTSYGYSRKHRALEIVCIVAVLSALAGFCVEIPQAIETPVGWISLALTAAAAYMAADVMSGLVHWGGDTLGHEKVWFVGPHFIGPFREHHIDQKAITRHDFVETNGNTCFFACVPVVVALLTLPEREGPGLFAGAFVAFVALFVMATNQFHKWAHMDAPPAIARWLQRAGLILRPAHHEIHHARPHDKHYCITVGWMNPVLNKVRFFRGVEWVIAQVRPSWLHIEHRALYTASRLAASASASLTDDNPHGPTSPPPCPHST